MTLVNRVGLNNRKVGVSIVDMLGEPSRVALITTSFGSIEALGIGISGVQLGSISIKSCVCAFSFNEYDSTLLYFFFTITLCSSR